LKENSLSTRTSINNRIRILRKVSIPKKLKKKMEVIKTEIKRPLCILGNKKANKRNQKTNSKEKNKMIGESRKPNKMIFFCGSTKKITRVIRIKAKKARYKNGNILLLFLIKRFNLSSNNTKKSQKLGSIFLLPEESTFFLSQ
jgi:hypothetical protein